MPEIVEALIKGGHASAAPPLGPALGPLGVNITDVINQINEKTKMFEGMDIPVKIIIDGNKNFTIIVGTPPVSSILKKELGKDKLATIDESNTRKLAGDISFKKIIEIAKCKEDVLYGDLKSKVKQILGTCVSCGVTIDGKNPKDIIKEIDDEKIIIK
ncbi:MAG: 50S ribosomal protein L11 [Candidatus Aenigmatarchaeota archaeon]